MQIRRILALLVLSIATACGGSDGVPVDAGGPGPSTDAGVAALCTRDPALIDQKAECRSDDLCPCGTHCELGECIATCRADGDCASGSYCDTFGRCRATTSLERIAPLSAQPQVRSQLDVTPSVFQVADAQTPYFVTLKPSNGKAGPARVVARGDVELTCSAGAAPTAECRFASVPVEGLEIALRYRTLPGPGARQSEQGMVEIFDEAGHARSVLGLPVRSTTVAVAGTYLGFAWLEGMGEPDAASLAPIRSPTRVLVFEQGGRTVLSITDQLGGALDGTVVLEATRSSTGALQARFPTRITYAADTLDGTAAEVVLSSSTAPGTGKLGGGHVELSFPILVAGLDVDGVGLPHRLVVSAERSGDLPEGATAGAPTPDATPTEDLLRGRQPSPLFAAARAEAEDGDPRTVAGDRAPFAYSATEGSTPAACFASPSEIVEAAEGLRADAQAEACSVVVPSFNAFNRANQNMLTPRTSEDCSLEDRSGDLGAVCAVDLVTDGQNFGSYTDCARMAAARGCTVVPAGFGHIVYETTYGGGLPYTVRARSLCMFELSRYVPPADRTCLGTVACLDESAGLGARSRFTEFVSEQSGDPLCRDEVTFGVLEAVDQEPADILAQCTTDLSRDLSMATDLASAFGSAGCVDRGRWRLRLETAARATLDGRHDPAVEGMVGHLVQQWLQVHALVARIGMNQLREDLVLAASGDPTADAVAALDTSLTGWSTVLQPSVAGALLATSSTALQRPDPRPALGFSTTDAVATAGVGVAVDLLETAAEQAEMIDALLSRAWFEGNASRLDARKTTAGQILRIAGLAGALAEDLHRRANQGAPSTWETAWQRAVPRYQLAVERLTKRVELVLSGANPIGIEDSDLPLYYRGAPVSSEERFGATSRFLTGEGPGSTAIAPTAIDRARVALDAARARWSERRSVRDLGDRRIQDIKFRYGELITGYCGASIENDTNYAGPGQAPCIDPGSQSVFECPEIDTEYCFVEEACRPRAQAFAEELTSADLGYSLCVGAELSATYGASVIGLSRELTNVLRTVDAAMRAARTRQEVFPIRIVSFGEPTANQRVATISFEGRMIDVPLDALGGLDIRVPEAALRTGTDSTSGGAYQQLLASCEVSRQKMLALRPGESRASCMMADDCSRGAACRNERCAPLGQTDPLDTVDCYYDGAISEQAIAVRGAANDIQIAIAEFDEFSQRYDIVKRSCLILKTGGAELESETADHDEIMTRLDTGRTLLASIEAGASATKDCAGTVSGAGVGGLSGAPVVACGAAFVEAAARIGGAVLEQEMSAAERTHDAAMLRLQNKTDLALCLNDAELELVGARAATLRVLKAQQDQATAVINLRGQKSYTLGLFNEGNAAVRMEEARLERSLPSQFALSEAAQLFTTRMAYAQRVTYLAVRAAEYEYQASLQARQQVMAATRPDQLESALQTVTALVNANRVAGAAPGSLHAVLSLRDHLLQLGDRSADPAGQQALSEEERFRALLTAADNGVYDANGTYLGQLIPFSISPLGRLGRGLSQGVPILADNDCAERVWSVNAAVLGTGVFEGNASSFTRLDLLKTNTFYSQWCSRAPDGSDFQTASVRPAVNLFFDPADPNRAPLDDGATAPYTRGRMQPYLNVSRSEFEKEDYSQGATTELAGRGLYGDYGLFIPAGVLSVGSSEGLKLERIDDILLRLDYVSVAKN